MLLLYSVLEKSGTVLMSYTESACLLLFQTGGATSIHTVKMKNVLQQNTLKIKHAMEEDKLKALS